MATFRPPVIPTVPIAKVSTGVLSGTVTADSLPVARTIKVFKNNENCVLATTMSDSSGNFSIEVNAVEDDVFTLIAVGNDGENSAIFKSVKAVIS